MKRLLTLLAISTALLACDKKQHDQPAPAPKPTETGGVVAPAPPPAPPPSQPMPVACAELHIAVAKDKVSHSRDTTVDVPIAGAIDPAALGASLAERAAKCVGPVLVTAGDDVGYQDIVTVLDVARAKGFTDVGFGETSMHNDPVAPIDKDTLAKAPVVVVTKTEVGIGDTKIAIDAANLERQVQDALAAAKPAGAPSGGVVVLQADVATNAKTINAIVRAGNQAGYGNLLFAVQSK